MAKLVLIVVLLALGAVSFVIFKPLLQGVDPEPSGPTVYKWQDDQGQWQITAKPPAEGTAYTAQETLPMPVLDAQ